MVGCIVEIGNCVDHMLKAVEIQEAILRAQSSSLVGIINCTVVAMATSIVITVLG